MKLDAILFPILSIIMIIVIIFSLTLLVVETKNYDEYITKMDATLQNKELTELINGSNFNNLPSLNIMTNNTEITSLNSCKSGATWLGQEDKDYTNNCYSACGGNGKVIKISNSDEYYVNNSKLLPGYWCVIESVYCNPNTGYIAATVNGGVCKSRFPRMFGGNDATTIVACGNNENPVAGILYDYKYNVAVDATTVNLTDEDEKLQDGTFRFACKYKDDNAKNKYVEHPLDRFHPQKDSCLASVFAAHRDAHVNFTEEGWTCDCGEYNTTRIKNLNGPQSKCTSCLATSSKIADNTYEHKIPINCITLYSTPDQIPNLNPCPGELFVRQGNQCSTTTLRVANTGKHGFAFMGTENKICNYG